MFVEEGDGPGPATERAPLLVHRGYAASESGVALSTSNSRRESVLEVVEEVQRSLSAEGRIPAYGALNSPPISVVMQPPTV